MAVSNKDHMEVMKLAVMEAKKVDSEVMKVDSADMISVVTKGVTSKNHMVDHMVVISEVAMENGKKLFNHH